MRTCNHCWGTFPESEFHDHRNRTRRECKRCVNWKSRLALTSCSVCSKVVLRSETFNKSYCDPCGRRRQVFTDMNRKYGITYIQYAMKLDEQGHKCKICRAAFDKADKKTSPNVDHDHETGRVRDILCTPCNTGLGLFRDDQKILSVAVEYLARHSQGHSGEDA